MRIVSLTTLAVAFTALAAAGQTMSPCSSASNSFLAGSPDAYVQHTSLPYTATVRATFEQQLADGNRITETSDVLEAHDSKGRSLRMEPIGCDTDAEGQPQIKVRVSIYDPVDHTSSIWFTGPGTLKLATTARMVVAPPVMDWATIQRTEQPMLARHATVRDEDLGPRTIAGILANGKRTTRTYPSGSEGNDSPIQTVRDEWIAPSSRLLLLVNDVDPRHGTGAWEVTSFTNGEPDPKLFDPPAGYVVRHITSTQTTAPQP